MNDPFLIILSGFAGSTVIATVLGALLLQRNKQLEASITSSFQERFSLFASRRAWKEKCLAELLGPMVMQLQRSDSAFRRWTEKNRYLEAHVVFEANSKVRDLLLAHGHLIPPHLMVEASQLVEHYDRWLEEFDKVRVRTPVDLTDDAPFVFVGPAGFPFPKDAEQGFLEEFAELQEELFATARYDRTQSLDYAAKYWDSVCSDHYVGTSESPPYTRVDASAKFQIRGDLRSEDVVVNGNVVIDWKPIYDCAHFLSCCIGNPPGTIKGGGLPLRSDYRNGPYGILGAQRLLDTILDRGWGKIVAEKTSREVEIAKIDAGDLIFYWSQRSGRYIHSALYLGGGNKAIACHTYCRSNQARDKRDIAFTSTAGPWTLVKML